jgi:DNA-binding MarR family transcriptional regulator
MQLDSLPAQILLATARQGGSAAELRCLALLARASAGLAIQAAMQRDLARSGLTEPGFGILSVLLAHDPEALLRSDLAVAAGLSPMRTDDALTRLEMSQLVQRHRDAGDRRLVWLHLTEAGRTQITDALQRYVAGSALVTESLNEQELAASIEISARLRQGAARLSVGTLISTVN